MKTMWTHADQRTLEELTARKAKFEEENRAPLLALARTCFPSLAPATAVDRLIAYADDFRDALEPFDSGVRPPKAPSMPTPPAAPKYPTPWGAAPDMPTMFGDTPE